jgi:hypothetical protein
VPSVIYKSFPVTGVEVGSSDGDLKILGKCSDGAVDHDGDIISPQFMASAVKAWLGSYPAVRLQHRGDSPIGKGLEAWQDAEGATYLKALIVDEAAQKLVRKGVLTAFSVGLSDPQTRKSARCPRWEIVGGRLTEVSVVDAPSNARCGIKIIGKSASGVPEFIGKAWDMAGKPGKIGKLGKVEKAFQRFSGDPEGFARWLAKRAQANREESLRAFLVETVNSTNNPLDRETARQELRRYGLG